MLHGVVPIQLHASDQTNGNTKRLPDFGKRAVEEIKRYNERVWDEYSLGKFMNVPEEEEFHLIQALQAELLGPVAGVDEEA